MTRQNAEGKFSRDDTFRFFALYYLAHNPYTRPPNETTNAGRGLVYASKHQMKDGIFLIRPRPKNPGQWALMWYALSWGRTSHDAYLPSGVTLKR
jgi:hypothetical protein